MIKSIRIKDFQSHVDNTLHFDKGYNVIVGKSGVGKTSILRALRFVLYNSFRGDFFIRRPSAEEAIVTVDVNGDIVTRIKDKGIRNEYFLNNHKWSKFGVEVPKEIIKSTNIKEVCIDTNDSKRVLNIQYSDQYDIPFILGESIYFKAKYINRLAGNHIVEYALKDFTVEKKEIENNKKTIKDRLTALEGTDKLKLIIDNLEKTLNHVESEREIIVELTDYKDILTRIQDKHVSWKKLNDDFIRFNDKLNRIDEIALLEKVELLEKLTKYKNKLSFINTQLGTIAKYTKIIDDINYDYVYSNINLLALLSDLKNKYLDISSMLKNIVETKNLLEKDICTKKQKYIDIIRNHGKCPICLNDIDDSVIAKVEAEL